MNKEIIFFDLDDTLVIEKKSAKVSFIEAAKYAEKIYSVNPNQLLELVKQEARKIWYNLPTYQYFKQIGISSWEGLWAKFNGNDFRIKEFKKIKDNYQISSWYNALLQVNIDDVNIAKELSERFNKERRKRHILFPEVREILEKISLSYRLGIITNGIPDLQWEKIKGAKIQDFFEHIIISGDFNVGKPEKKIFSIALRKFETTEKKCIMVGNSLKTDILGARNIGIDAVWINRKNKENYSQIKPDFTITNLKELMILLED